MKNELLRRSAETKDHFLATVPSRDSTPRRRPALLLHASAHPCNASQVSHEMRTPLNGPPT